MPCERQQDPARPHTSQLAWSDLKLPTNRRQLFHQGSAGSGLSVYDCSDVVDIWFRNQKQSIERPRLMCLSVLPTLCDQWSTHKGPERLSKTWKMMHKFIQVHRYPPPQTLACSEERGMNLDLFSK